MLIGFWFNYVIGSFVTPNVSEFTKFSDSHFSKNNAWNFMPLEISCNFGTVITILNMHDIEERFEISTSHRFIYIVQSICN